MTPSEAIEQLCVKIADADVAGDWVLPDGIAEATAMQGAYIVCLRLPSSVAVNLRRGQSGVLAAGWYSYVGSAWGNGGIRARLNRHFRRSKSLHWHIDRLTVKADQIAGLALIGRSECDVVGRLLQSRGFSVAMTGFGSTDCRRCESHLLTHR